MINKHGYTRFVGPTGSGLGENNLVNQTSPSWVLTFIRWSIRDTWGTMDKDKLKSTSTRDPLIVKNDCVQVSTTSDKSTLTPNMSATLLQTDVNYETAIAPGDFVFVNILNWQADADRIVSNVEKKLPINGPDDGFKGVYKIQSVRKTLSINPENGVKSLLFKITGFAFTEFNNTIYFNPFLIDDNQKNNILFINNIGADWELLVGDKGLVVLQDIIRVLIKSFIGIGVGDDGNLKIKTGSVVSPNIHFFIPSIVGKLLGVSGAKSAKDIYNYMFGIQHYNASQNQSLSVGMNPAGLTNPEGRFSYTDTPCAGVQLLKAEYWNQVKAWAILNQYTNSPLNEMYTCFRIAKNNKVMPTLVFRQIPFTTEDFQGSATVTKFMNIPRWQISPAMVYSLDLGRDEAARFNFMQYFGRSAINVNGAEISQEIAQGNYVYDTDDVQRNGLRPMIVTVQFDDLANPKTTFASPDWAEIVGDSLFGGHLRMNGTLECAGIIDPISVGDNLDFDGVIYHIEQVSHSCFVTSGQDGKSIKSFRTTISVSHGVSKESNKRGTVYPEMQFPNAFASEQNDFKGNQLLPGVSVDQSFPDRTDNAPFPSDGSTPPTPEDDTKGNT